MKRFIFASAVVVAIAFPAILRIRALGQTRIEKAPAETGADPHRAMVATYCFTCHNTRLKTGGLALDGLDLRAAANDAQIWWKGLGASCADIRMPPPGSSATGAKVMPGFVCGLDGEHA